MNGVERAQHVLLPFQPTPTHPDRRRRRGDASSFGEALDGGAASIEPAAPADEAPPADVQGHEGVGERVNVVA